jgi:cytidine deaminase
MIIIAGGVREPTVVVDSEMPMTSSRVDAKMTNHLLALARDAASRAYAPYSNFPVGAAILTESGEIVTGANIENASFGLACCAERTAAFTAAAAGHRTFLAVAVTAPRLAAVTPCGACRQVLNEFKPADGDLIVILDGEDGPIPLTIDELLPRAFGPVDLS